MLWVEKSIPTMDLEEIEQFISKNKKAERSNLFAKLITMKYKGKENIREYIMEMSNLTAKLKSLKLEIAEDLVLISLLAHFGQFKVSYNTQKEKWSLNELISHCVQEEEKLQRDRTKNARLVLTSQNKKRKNIKGVAEGSSQRKKLKKNEEFTCYFCKKSGHMKKQCPKYAAWCIKKASWNEQQYFITLIDDDYRYGYLYLIHEKSQTLYVFKSFKAEIELQLGKKSKPVKSDRGDEYYGRYDESREQLTRPFALFLRECGIVPQYTMPSKPSMNGVAERQNRTLKDMVRNTTPVIRDNVQTIVPDIVPEQDYDETFPQTPIEQPQQPQEVPLRRSIRERRHIILDDYIVFCQAMQSSNSKKWINAMKDELKSMQDNEV
ncbi:hypothetical protein CR513_21307, partial [Mucuna pruriens]